MLVTASPRAQCGAQVPGAAAVGRRPRWIFGCLYLFISLPTRTQLFFLAAQVIGLVLYAIYGSRAAERARSASA